MGIFADVQVRGFLRIQCIARITLKCYNASFQIIFKPVSSHLDISIIIIL